MAIKQKMGRGVSDRPVAALTAVKLYLAGIRDARRPSGCSTWTTYVVGTLPVRIARSASTTVLVDLAVCASTIPTKTTAAPAI